MAFRSSLFLKKRLIIDVCQGSKCTSEPVDTCFLTELAGLLHQLNPISKTMLSEVKIIQGEKLILFNKLFIFFRCRGCENI